VTRAAPPVAALAVVIAACAEPPPPPTAPPEGPGLTVLTYNVNFEQFNPATVDAIRAADADIVFLQETTAQWETALRAGLADVYPFIELRHHDPDGGMGVLARVGVVTRAWVPSPVGKFPAWCLTLDTAAGSLDVLHVHLHPPLDENGSLVRGYFTTSDDRLLELQAFLQCFDGPPDLAVGDFNEGEGDAVALIEANGLRDAASAHPPVSPTWRWETGFWTMEGRPDHVFAAPPLHPRSVRVIEAGGSDHRPLLVDLVRAP
jgi:endonuclease/exonuclease/phosphatase (EEP) superfamily protein YafD